MSAVITRDQEIQGGLIAKQKMVTSLLGGDKAKSDKFIATAAKVATDSKLSGCNPHSIIDACITVAQLGLDLSPVLSHAYLVPFKGSIQLIVSARGYTALLARTGWKLKTYIVNEGDVFEYHIDGFEETVKFVKDLDGGDGAFKYAVALAQSPDGTLYVEVMNASQIDKHRLVSSNQNGKPSGVWAQWFDEMAIKTVAKKLVKKLPIGEEMAYAVNVDDKTIETVEAIPTQKEQPVDLNAMLQTAIPQEKKEPTPKDNLFEFFQSRGIKNDEMVEFLKWAKVYTDDEESIAKFLGDRAGSEALLETFFLEKEVADVQ